MNRKFKHKTLGYIANKIEDSNKYKVQISTNDVIPAWVIETDGNWQEVIDRDFEILSLEYEGIMYDQVDKVKEDWRYSSSNGGHCLLSQAGKDICGMINIHSIKRLSDGVVFSIGDKIESVTNRNFSTKRNILKFGFVSNKFYVYLEGTDGTYSENELGLMKHVKKPLFRTFDGVDVFKGDKVWFLKDLSIESHYSFIVDCQTIGNNVFSTEKAIRKYIEENKPKYSERDIKKAIQFGCEISIISSYSDMFDKFMLKFKND